LLNFLALTGMSKRLSVLLADDSRFFRAIESQFLQKTPVKILEADNSSSALSIIREERPDLAFIAFSLPGGGAELCKSIKADITLRSMPVVIVCDQDETDQPEMARLNNCDALLVKPLDRHSFLQVGRQFIEEIREHRQPSFFPVTFSVDGEEYSGKCLDLSGGGLFVESQAEIPSGSLVKLTFKLPDVMGTQFTCSAEVSWLNQKPKPMKPHYPHGLGLKFVGLPEVLHKAILRMTDKKPSS
jgi:CheY-like chemotaxis protein